MRSLRRLLLPTAALAASLAVPTAAAADPVCVSVGYSVLGSGSSVAPCVLSTPWGATAVGGDVGDPGLVYLEAGVSVPSPAF